MNSRSRLDSWSYSRNPWVYFFLFVSISAVLSYFRPASLEGILLFSLVLGITLGYALLYPGEISSNEKSIFDLEPLPFIPVGPMVFLFVLFLFVRFYQSQSFSFWPTPDEGISGIFSMELAKKWEWHFFYQFSQVPSVFIWMLAVFYNIFTPSLTSLRLFPSLLSVLILFANFAVTWMSFSRGFAFLSTILLGFNFWFLYTGNYCLSLIVVVFWIWGSFLLLALLHKSRTALSPLYGLLLGTFVGFGFFVSIPWLLFAIPSCFVAWFAFKKKGHKDLFYYFLCPVILGFASFVLAGVHEGYGKHILDLMSRPPGTNLVERAQNIFSYLSIPFWGANKNFDYYGPLWGGLFNPIEDGLFFIGLVEWRPWSKPGLERWILFFFGINLLPGLLTNDLDMFRLLQLLPLVLLTVAGGLQALISRLPSYWKVKVAMVLIGMSLGLNLYHLEGPGNDVFRHPNYRSADSWQAYQILKKESAINGIGAVLSEFRIETFDQTLAVCCQPFDVCRNARYSGVTPNWVGLMINSNEEPFLRKRFPEGEWFSLSPVPNSSPNNLELFIIPLNSMNQKSLVHWVKVDRLLQKVNYFMLMYGNLKTGLMNHSRLEDVLKQMAGIYPEIKGDPFLESCFYEKVSVFFEMDHNPEAAGKAIEDAIHKGYPAANLYNDEGVILAVQKRYPEARRAFRFALKCPVNFTPSAQNLKNLAP